MKKIILSSAVITFALVLAGCSQPSTTEPQPSLNDRKTESQNSNNPEASTPKQDQAKQTAKYKIEFVADWSQTTHPNNYPSGAHFSPFIAYSHNDSVEAKIFTIGETPTPGVEEMAETGATEILVKETQSIIDAGNALAQTKGKRIDSPGKDSGELELAQDYNYLTFVSMLAPSPDWFVTESINLFKDNQWIEKIEIDLITYDAGGDDGENFTSADQDSSPKETIKVFDENIQNLGKIVLTKIDE